MMRLKTLFRALLDHHDRGISLKWFDITRHGLTKIYKEVPLIFFLKEKYFLEGENVVICTTFSSHPSVLSI